MFIYLFVPKHKNCSKSDEKQEKKKSSDTLVEFLLSFYLQTAMICWKKK